MAIVTLTFHYLKKRRWAKYTLFGMLLFFLATATRPLSYALAKNLEDRFDPISEEQLDECDHCDIIVLGSGHTADHTLPATMQLSEAALARLSEGIRLWLMSDSARLIVSGYGANESSLSQAEVLAGAAVQLGVDSSKILLQKEPTNTYEEAQYYKNNYYQDQPLILVTSAMHMRRASHLFEKKGINTIQAPTDFRVKEDPNERESWLRFSTFHFELIKLAMHEYVGMWYAKWRY